TCLEAKPAASIARVYGPGATLRKTYSPVSFETVVRSMVVCVFRSTTLALAMTAPLGSRTTPFSEAVESWADAGLMVLSRQATGRRKRTHSVRVFFRGARPNALRMGMTSGLW